MEMMERRESLLPVEWKRGNSGFELVHEVWVGFEH
jgi:hypothetical protein